ncbi:hypothetical protein ABC977_14685 [Thioalkalicoccus limnaeus]|uniref:Uncharacterized protein n=1 Tax=Thioalkalicoccus limnaeus TaxID=120681 RepID=A0ABV4BK12_9GAMM
MERTFRAEDADGSVATTLFVGDTLEAVEIDRNCARGIRRLVDGETLDLGFVKRREMLFLFLIRDRPPVFHDIRSPVMLLTGDAARVSWRGG